MRRNVGKIVTVRCKIIGRKKYQKGRGRVGRRVMVR
jgi:hypothetical protein